MKGRLIVETVSSQVLKGNPLGDPHRREVPVYLPPSYGKAPRNRLPHSAVPGPLPCGQARGRRWPVIYYLVGFSGDGRSVINHRPWKENLVERLDRLIVSGRARECVLVVPDCFTAYGGSQYINSSATGRYEDHIVSELVPFMEDKLGLAREASGRAVMGKSSGGYGALSLGMRHPDVFAHVASHSGDMFFEMSYVMDIPKFVNALWSHGQSAERYVRKFLASRRKDLFDISVLNIVAMSSCYSPNPKSRLGFDLPCDERTGELIPKVWARWLEKDPVVMAAKHKSALKSLETLFMDCGRKDEFFLHLGARKLSDTLKRLGVKHVYEEHEFGHMDMSERYDRSLVLLSRFLSAVR